jgi:hypothetical protein
LARKAAGVDEAPSRSSSASMVYRIVCQRPAQRAVSRSSQGPLFHFFCLLYYFFCLLIYFFRSSQGFVGFASLTDATTAAQLVYSREANRLQVCRAPEPRDVVWDALVQVSVLLCTVTFHANRAHNLTRSP